MTINNPNNLNHENIKNTSTSQCNNCSAIARVYYTNVEVQGDTKIKHLRKSIVNDRKILAQYQYFLSSYIKHQ